MVSWYFIGKKAAKLLFCWPRTDGLAPEPPIAVARHVRVKTIAQGPWNRAQGIQLRPRTVEFAQQGEHGVGTRVHLAARDQNDRLRRRTVTAREQSMRNLGLQRGELNPPRSIMPDRKPNGRMAEVAHTIKEENRRRPSALFDTTAKVIRPVHPLSPQVH